MCSGKTTLGRALARTLNFCFVDIDEKVEEIAGMKVKEVFDKKGEAEFRKLEFEALELASKLDDAVVACGGGTPCRPGAMELMNKNGITVYLKPNAERLLERLMEGREKRPLIMNISSKKEMHDFLTNTLRDREKYYSLSSAIFDSSFLESDKEISESTNKFIKEICPNIHRLR